jgi:hypothetical protein
MKLLQSEAHWIATLAMHRCRHEAEQASKPIMLTPTGAAKVQSACQQRLEELEPGAWTVNVQRIGDDRFERRFDLKVTARTS